MKSIIEEYLDKSIVDIDERKELVNKLIADGHTKKSDLSVFAEYIAGVKSYPKNKNPYLKDESLYKLEEKETSINKVVGNLDDEDIYLENTLAIVNRAKSDIRYVKGKKSDKEPTVKTRHKDVPDLENNIDYSNIDYTNPEHVKSLLKITDSDYGIGTTLRDCLTDLKIFLQEIKITDKQKEILSLYKRYDSLDDVAKILNCTPQNIYKTINGIVKKIIKLQ